MQRRDFLKAISATASSLALSGCLKSHKMSPGKKTPSNRTFLLADNMGWTDMNAELNICKAPYFADPTGRQDCTEAILRALDDVTRARPCSTLARNDTKRARN